MLQGVLLTLPELFFFTNGISKTTDYITRKIYKAETSFNFP